MSCLIIEIFRKMVKEKHKIAHLQNYTNTNNKLSLKLFMLTFFMIYILPKKNFNKLSWWAQIFAKISPLTKIFIPL